MANFNLSFFLERLRFKYKLSVLNENTLEETWHVRFSRLNVFLYLFLLFVVIFLFNLFLLVKTPLKQLLPGYADMELKPRLAEETLRADSLAQELKKNDDYLVALKSLIAGDVKIEQEDTKDDLVDKAKEQSFLAKSSAEAEFCDQFENEEKYRLSASAGNPDDENRAPSIVFGTPANGVVIKKFQENESHFGIDILTAPNESIRAVADGHILSVQYTIEDGYVALVQHADGFVSVYKQNSPFLKNSGAQVKAGESLAIVVGAHGQTGKPYVHFELWHNGKPENPENYITF